MWRRGRQMHYGLVSVLEIVATTAMQLNGLPLAFLLNLHRKAVPASFPLVVLRTSKLLLPD